MRKFGLIFLLMWGWCQAEAQDTLTLIPEHFQPQWMLLRYLQGSKAYYLKSADSVRQGRPVSFILEGQPAGEYAIQYDVNNSRGFRFIYNHENVQLAFDPDHPYKPRVARSRENKVYFSFLRQWDSLTRAINRLKTMYIRRPADSLQEHYRRLRDAYEDLFARYRRMDSSMMAWHFIGAHYKRWPDSLLPTKEADARYAQQHYFDGIDMNDTVLFHSNILTDRIFTYTLGIPVKAYGKRRSDVYLWRMNQVFDRLHYPPMRSDILRGLIEVFARRDRTVKDSLLTLYAQLPEAYKDEAFIARMKQSNVPIKGEKFPVAQLYALGKFHLDGRKKYHLFVFYSSGCPHCRRALPAVHEALKHNDQIDVIAIGLEEEPLQWKTFIKPLTGWQHLIATDETYSRLITRLRD